MKRSLVSLMSLVPLTLLGCGSSGGGGGNNNCTMPTGSNTAKYVVNKLLAPNKDQGVDPASVSIDLDGDGKADNQLAALVKNLVGVNFMVQAGLDSAVNGGKALLLIAETSTDANQQTADCAGTTLQLAAPTTGAPDFSGNGHFTATGSPSDTFAGPISGGKFDSENPVTATAPKTVTIQLPLVQGAATPLTLKLTGAHVSYTRSGTGLMTGAIQGGLLKTDLVVVIGNVAQALTDILMTNGPNADLITRALDNGGTPDPACASMTNKGCKNPDGSCSPTTADKKIDFCEISTSLVANALAPDIQLYQGTTYKPTHVTDKSQADALSVGIGFTAVQASY